MKERDLKFREEKTTQAAARLIQAEGGAINHMKLIKLLYLADRLALVRWGRPVSYDWYFSLKHGPVLSFTLNKINEDPDPNEPTYWHKYISERQGHTIRLLQPSAPSDQLSGAELALLDEVYRDYGACSQWKLRDITHQLPEWRDPEGSRLPIHIADILGAEGFSKDDIQNVIENLLAEQAALDLLS